MNPRRVVLPEAEEEIGEALSWYEGQRPGLGLEFLGTVEAAMDRAATAPDRWPTWDLDGRYRRVGLHRFPYLLFFELRPGAIEFVAVAHVRREPGYWLERVRLARDSASLEKP